ncbi:MAG: hypothetical protein VX929_14455 [Pseudomonadota bacterium]|nr:hypothetical protein [Pseudomonadota bacterium]
MTHPTLLILNSVIATAARLAIPLFVAILALALVIALSMTAASNRHAAIGEDLVQTHGESSIAQSEPLGTRIVRQPVRVAGRDS